MLCPACKAENDDTHDTCFKCGKGLRTLVEGSVLASRYEILSPIGRGGMGMVYKARDRVLHGEIVAIKVMRGDFAGSSELARRFRSEVLLARKVRHRNVCGIHDYHVDGDLEFIAMELIEGVDLRQVLRERGPLPPEEAYPIAIQIAEGLEAIHEAGILHRDLKTPNVMRDRRGIVRLMDFGIAKSLAGDGSGGGTATGSIIGTPEYMSPEQVRGDKDIDQRSDLYALGIMIWELFTGQVPFRGDTQIATLFKHMQEPPPFDSEVGRRLPPALVPVLKKALAKEPADRYASARDVIDALREAHRDSLGSASSVGATKVPGATLVSGPTFATGPLDGAPTMVAAAPPPVPPPSAAPPPPPMAAAAPAAAPAPDAPPLSPHPAPAKSRWPLLLVGSALVLAAVAIAVVMFQGRRAPRVWTNPADGLLYVTVPPGRFQMGCVPQDRLCDEGEKPRHDVELTAPIRMGQTEVPVKAFRRFVAATAHQTTAEKEGSGGGTPDEGLLDLTEEAPNGRSWKNPGITQDENHPVVQVSWEDAAAYCKWAGGRLPTEAEWEYAARAGREGTLYVWGDAKTPNVGGRRHANVADEAGKARRSDWQIFDGYNDGFVETAPVGTFAPNGFGLHDMAGNVWEWTADWYDGGYYAASPAQDPAGPAQGRERVLRGGAWFNQSLPLRVSNRIRERPNRRTPFFGFRCAVPVG